MLTGLLDKEMKAYYGDRTKAIIDQSKPYEHLLEQIMCALMKRNKAYF